jgi:hypothetical protein
MPTSAIDSLIFRDIFGSPAMREIWSDTFRTQKYLDWEAALARAEATRRSATTILLSPRKVQRRGVNHWPSVGIAAR